MRRSFSPSLLTVMLAALFGAIVFPSFVLAAETAWGLSATDPALAAGPRGVQWKGWSPHVFADAVRANRLVCLFVTAPWSHTHTLEGGAFSDLEVATRLNEDTLPVRIDRDAHPDLDVRLQNAAQALAGTRGWPLLVIAAPTGEPLWADVSVGAEDDFETGRPGLKTVLQTLTREWRIDREKLLEPARALNAKLGGAGAKLSGTLAPPALHDTALMLQKRLDAKAGNFNAGANASQFPAPRAIELLMTDYARNKDRASLNAACVTLDAMLAGGLFDHLGGGFFRCTADRWWRQPRFEKRLTENAELLATCAHAWQVTHEPRYREAVERTLNFWEKCADAKTGLFVSSLAADPENCAIGAYYTWSVKEVEAALPNDIDCHLAKLCFGIDDAGEWSGAAGRNVLFESIPLQDAAKQLKLSQADAAARLNAARSALLNARDARPAPRVDRTPYVDGNALMAAAFIACASALDEPVWRERGLRRLKTLIDREKPRELAADEAAVIYACAVGFEASQDEFFVRAFHAALERLQAFRDPESGGYFDCKESAELPAGFLRARFKSYQDTSEPSTNGLIALALARMAAATGDAELLKQSRVIVEAFGKVLPDLGPYGATLVLAGTTK